MNWYSRDADYNSKTAVWLWNRSPLYFDLPILMGSNEYEIMVGCHLQNGIKWKAELF